MNVEGNMTIEYNGAAFCNDNGLWVSIKLVSIICQPYQSWSQSAHTRTVIYIIDISKHINRPWGTVLSLLFLCKMWKELRKIFIFS